MKSTAWSLMVFCSLGSALFAAEDPSFRFDFKIGLPALSLLEGTKESSPTILDDAAKFFRKKPSPTARIRKVVPQMPVISPRTDIDYKLRIAGPNEAVDHKLIIKSQAIEASK